MLIFALIFFYFDDIVEIEIVIVIITLLFSEVALFNHGCAALLIL